MRIIFTDNVNTAEFLRVLVNENAIYFQKHLGSFRSFTKFT